MPTDMWACSCHHYFDEFDIARQHSRLQHDVITVEYRDGQRARERVETEQDAKEEAA